MGFVLEELGLFSQRTGMSLDDGTHGTNTPKYGQIKTESRLFHAPFHHHAIFPSFCSISLISAQSVTVYCYYLQAQIVDFTFFCFKGFLS